MPTRLIVRRAAAAPVRKRIAVAVSLGLLLSACGDTARLKESQDIGAHPEIPAADPPTIPTVNIAPKAESWGGRAPVASPPFAVTRFAEKLDHPRWLHVLPNGDVLVAESNAPEGHSCKSGLEGLIERVIMKYAGAGTRSANRITLLQDPDGDGIADPGIALLTGLNSPFGMALVGGHLYVANTDAVVRYPYVAGQRSITAAAERVLELPAAGGNCHWTRNLVASRDGSKLYIAVGAASDHGENGPAAESARASILEFDLATGARHVFASGLRNPVGLDWEPATGALWVAVNERDQLGSDLVPDYMTSVRQGQDFGWPCRYFGEHLDSRVPSEWPCPGPVASRPDYALGNHTASLGLAFSVPEWMPAPFAHGAFVGQHGSWNRKPRSGYKVVFVPFKNGSPASGPPVDVLTGFIDEQPNVLFDQGRALGRPVGVALHPSGALLVADDVGNIIWRLAPPRPGRAAAKPGR